MCTGYGAVEVDGDEGVAWSLRISIDGEISSSDVVLCEVAVVGVVLDLVLEDSSSDNMGNSKSNDGVLPAKEGKV